MQSMSVLSLGAFFFMANKAETKSLAHLTSVIKGTLWSMAIRQVLKKNSTNLESFQKFSSKNSYRAGVPWSDGARPLPPPIGISQILSI